MKIATYAVRNYQFTLVLFIMAIALGVNTLLTMPRSEDPATNSPMFPVIVVYPGTSPSDMEELVVKPLEKQIYSLENIKPLVDKLVCLYAPANFSSVGQFYQNFSQVDDDEVTAILRAKEARDGDETGLAAQ